ncbi:MAG: hypothetical protein HY301_14800 [Verrucomicrobia bacterium]|nr:hypothetical protein [Verrucomicrobiota bacterium]
MDFLKKHYEKIILSLVLLVVIFFAVRLPGEIRKAQKDLEALRNGIIRTEPRPVPAVDFTRNDSSITRARSPITNNLSGQHNLLNPVKWQRLPDGSIIKIVRGDEILRGFIVTKITTIKYTVAFRGISGAGDTVRYRIGVTDEGQANPVKRKEQVRAPGAPKATGLPEKNDLFKMVEVKGPPENPTEITVELVKDKQLVSFSKDKPSEQIIGYEADAKYDPEGKNWKGLRQDSKVQFANDTYKVIAITPTQVTIEGESTPKRTTVELTPAP